MHRKSPSWFAVLAIVMAGLAAVGAGGKQPAAVAGQGAGCVELIVNGGFEQGAAGWQQLAAPPLPAGVTLMDPLFPRTGTLSAYLADRNGAADRLSQTVTLPAGPASSALTFWWALSTQEEAGAFDLLQVTLSDAAGGQIAALVTLDNTSADDWVWSPESFDLTPYAGQTVTLRFTATNDATGSPTAFFVDDVSLLVCGAPPAETETPTATATPTHTATVAASPTTTATLTATPRPTTTASPTGTPSHTATVAPAGTATAMATPTRVPKVWRAYLPLALRH